MMRKLIISMAAAFAAAALLTSCGQGGHNITVTNDTDLDRYCETVEISQASLGDLNPYTVAIVDEAGNAIPSQVYTDIAGNTSLLFQATVPAQSEKTYTIAEDKQGAYDTLAYSRYVPERMDDYAYENNLVAGRIYGPSLEDPRTFGSDIWLKCTDRLIIDEWYEKADYHHNYGDGMDCYKVANTLGGGALVPYAGDGEKLVIGDNYATQIHVCDGPVRTEAVLEYAPFKVGDKMVSATRVLSLDANSRFVEWATTFHCEDADSIDVVLGAVMHDVVGKKAELNWIAFTEKASDSADPDRDGNISVAVVYDKAELDDNPYYTSGECSNGGEKHAVIITREPVGKAITTWTGSGWSQGGIESQESWAQLVKDFAYAQQHPLKVKVK